MPNVNLKDLIQANKDLRVLYVEDSEIVRGSTLELLNIFFSHIDVAEDGAIGLQKYQEYYQENQKYYDVVITDINMPHMSGIEMSQAIFEENDKQIIIIVSAHNESDYLLKLINMGISHFILKPINITQLQKTLVSIFTTLQHKRLVRSQYEEITEMNRSLEIAKNEAEEASKQKSQFLANMSHEIRTPLNAITGFISLLQEEETDPKKIKYLNIIQNSSDSLLQIISDILDISKIESGKLDITPIDFNPYDDLITIAELFQAKATQKSITLKIKYNSNMPKVLHADSLRIKQILSNLLSNAIKFTPENSMIKCIIWYHKGHLNIRVKDYGIGIPKEKQEHIFTAFSQAESSTEREYGGTGLGLAISRKLSEMLNGSLTLKSEEGKGSSFLLSLPMPEGQEKSETLTQAPTKETPLKGHILLVDDTETNRMFLGIVLENMGLTYDTANDGLEAIEQFNAHQYDVILMDENMPKLSGTGAAKAILEIEEQKNLSHTPIVSLTANALKGDKERFLEAGMDDYLSKPVNPVALTEVLRKYLH
jgi:signal transduction histidine kinase